MPGPPPPPPPGPPPPMFLGSGPPAKSAPEGRNLLLDSIHKGVQLKKATTNDRSAPLAAPAKTSTTSNNGRAGQPASAPMRSNGNAPSGGMGGASNGLGGLFAGGMPKLKPTGRAIGGTSVESPVKPGNAPSRNPSIGSGRRQFPGDVRNRGPPPQPPPATQKPGIATGAERKQERINNFKKQMSATSLVQQGVNLFSGEHKAPRQQEHVKKLSKRLSNASLASSSSYRTSNPAEEIPKQDRIKTIKKQLSKASLGLATDDQARSVSDGVLANGPPSLPSKPPVGNYGKPNVAPRPPGSDGKPAPPPKLAMNGNNRVSVTRAQSMRAPRSPPVAPPSQPPPAFKHLANFSQLHENPANPGYPAFHQSQDSIPNYRTNPPPRTSTLPSNLNHHGSVKTVAPAPPSTPPPPTPGGYHGRPAVRPPLTRPPPPPVRPPPPPSQAPPPPPHRTGPAPPPPPSLHNRLAPGPPPTPARNSSMRNGDSSGMPGNVERTFADRFHPMHEFPRPQPFRNIPKVFNSISVKQQAATSGKQQAPQPPMLQLGKKLYASDTSNC